MSDSGNRVNKGRRRFLVATTSVVGGVGAAVAAVPFAASWWPSARAQAAGAPVEADISKLEPGAQLTVEWRGKPVWIINRTPEMLQELKVQAEEIELRDPESQVSDQPEYITGPFRALNKQFLVLIGVCTHLGCAPLYRPDRDSVESGWTGGFFCPCHGSKFDLSGRVFAGVPAPTNLEVPPYRFVSDTQLVIGENPTPVEIAKLT